MPSSRLAFALFLVAVTSCAPSHDSSPAVLAGTEPSPEAACPHGGTRVLGGLDLDGNGVLDPPEVRTTHDVCSDAPPGLDTLVRIDPEVPDLQCPRGGTAVRSGLDRNHDGVLADDEVDHIDHLCRGLALIDVERFEHVAGCLDGGAAIHSGQDDNGNGVLDRSEITATRIECSEAVVASAFIQGPADVAALAHVKVVTGLLVISGDAPIQTVLPDLELVGGGLHVVHAPQLASLSLPRLQHDSGPLVVTGDDELREILLPTLEDVADTLAITADPKLERISLPVLGSVGGAQLDLSNNAALTQVELRSLEDVAGELRATSDPALGVLELPQVRSLGALSITGNPALARLRIGRETHVVRAEIAANPLLTSLDLGTAMTANELTIRDNGALAALVFPAFTGERVAIRDNAVLAELAVSLSSATTLEVHGNGLAKLTVQLGDAGASATIDANPSLHELAISGQRAHNLTIAGNPGIADLVVAVPRLDSCTVDGDHLAHLAFPLLAQATQLTVNAPLETLDLPTPRPAVAGIAMFHTRNITELPLEAMGTRTLDLEGNQQLARVVAGELTGHLDLSDNPALVSVAFRGDRLDNVLIEDNPRLSAIAGLEQVRSISVLLEIGNNALKRVDLPALISVGSQISLLDDAAFDAIDLHNLETAGIQLLLGHGVVEPPRLDALRHAHIVRIEHTSLTRIALPQLFDASALHVQANDQLTELALPALTQLHSATFTDNHALDACQIKAFFDTSHVEVGGQHGNLETGGCP